jgi:hypothetical protein
VTPGIQELMREVERVRDGFRRAVLAGDPEAAVALCTDAVTVTDLPLGIGAAGRDAARAVRTLWDHTTLLAGLGLPADAVHPAMVALGDGEGPRGWW